MNFLETLLEFLMVVIVVVSLVANCLVLLCFTCSAEVRAQVPGVFIINLSFCNILIAVLNMPSTFLGVVKRQKPFGDCFCYTVSFMDTFLTTNTMLSMAALSIDRWIAVVFPLTYSSKLRHKDAILMVSYAWLHSLAFSLTALLLSWVDYNPVYASCIVHLAEEGVRGPFMVFTLVFHSATFALSLFILCFTYLKVLLVARFHCRRIDVITVQTLLLLVDIHPSVKQRCLHEQKKRRRRATKKICIFIGSFVLCFAPYVITRLTELVFTVKINHYWGITSKCLMYSKAASDPFVYSLLRQQYKKALIGVCNRILGRNSYTLSGQSCPSDSELYTWRVKDECCG
ncbi:G-protein coupled receptor 26 [Triplophysa rosa]|uniref:G-protein coupled receptor 26-like n=1 Tax=Triplophysa rosa TaxID=992332 RepID=A0A9W7WZ80_TRIRA|nr:G-protein coupled receptor 26 [Triplophysa rosa]KAI7810894.1 putative G-protein coupled receptor 26-like [Triplophysa rosa]